MGKEKRALAILGEAIDKWEEAPAAAKGDSGRHEAFFDRGVIRCDQRKDSVPFLSFGGESVGWNQATAYVCELLGGFAWARAFYPSLGASLSAVVTFLDPFWDWFCSFVFGKVTLWPRTRHTSPLLQHK